MAIFTPFDELLGRTFDHPRAFADILSEMVLLHIAVALESGSRLSRSKPMHSFKMVIISLLALR
jgi:hypothetical protein